MKRVSAAILPALALIGCEFLLQWHSWRFWAKYFDIVAGPGVALVLSGLALAWWFSVPGANSMMSRFGLTALAVVTTCVCLAGPLIVVSEPLVDGLEAAAHEHAAVHVEIRRLDLAIDSRRAELASYQKITAQGRRGWFDLIQDTRAQLADLEAQRSAIQPVQPAKPWRTWVNVALQALALILLQIGAAAMSHRLGHRFNSGAGEADLETVETGPVSGSETNFETVETETAEASNDGDETVETKFETTSETAAFQVDSAKPETFHETVETVVSVSGEPEFQVARLQRRIKKLIADSGESNSAWCRDNDVNPRDLSFLLHHQKRIKDGQPVISRTKLLDLVTRFLNTEAVAASA